MKTIIQYKELNNGHTILRVLYRTGQRFFLLKLLNGKFNDFEVKNILFDSSLLPLGKIICNYNTDITAEQLEKVTMGALVAFPDKLILSHNIFSQSTHHTFNSRLSKER